MKRMAAITPVSLILLVILVVGMNAQTTRSSTGSFTFYAIYDRVAGSESLDEPRISRAAMSGDGKKLVFSNYHNVYTVDADGSNLATFPEPEPSWGIHSVTIDQDGSRAFFAAPVKGTGPWTTYTRLKMVQSLIFSTSETMRGLVTSVRFRPPPMGNMSTLWT